MAKIGNIFGRAIVLAVALFGLVSLGATSPVATPDKITVKIRLDRTTISVGEQAMLEVVVSGPQQKLPSPNMPKMGMFEVYSQGRSSNVTISNGVVTSSVSYRYMLLPRKEGVYPIGPISVVHNNKRFASNSLELTVLTAGTSAPREDVAATEGQGGQSPDYFLEALVDSRTPFVSEQVTLTLKFCIAVEYYSSPELTEPTTTGFWTEVIGNNSPYRQKINGRTYRVIERLYALFPTQSGELTIGRAAIRTTIAGKRRRKADPFKMFNTFFGQGEEITVRSKPITIKVKPLPSKGRPEEFTGTVGKFQISATIDKNEVEVNQPVTVIFKIRGTGNIKSVAEPTFPDLDDFRIYKASSSETTTRQQSKLGGTKVYEEVFIPRRPGRLTIPSISFSYFDPGAGKYRRENTKPMELNVTKPEGWVAGADSPYRNSDFAIGSKAQEIRYIKGDIGDLQPVGRLTIRTPLYLIINGLPLALLAGVVVVRRRREKLEGDIGYARARSAARMAHKRLASAQELAAVDTVGKFYTEINNTLISYVADKLNSSPHGLTIERIVQLLEQRSASPETVESVSALLSECDFARFAPASFDQSQIDAALAKAEQIMIAIEGVKFD